MVDLDALIDFASKLKAAGLGKAMYELHVTPASSRFNHEIGRALFRLDNAPVHFSFVTLLAFWNGRYRVEGGQYWNEHAYDDWPAALADVRERLGIQESAP